jgi:amphi-Trp domain-containing protein
MPRRSERDIEKAYPRKDFVAKLRRLADSIEAGKSFSIQVAGERLHIPADAIFNIEHEREGGVDELEFQVRWKRE